jgi:hypothetical protein
MTKIFARGLTFVLSIFALGLAIGVAPAAAQERWCLDEPGAGLVTCIFQTFAQCQASRPGGSTFCIQYPGAPGTAGPQSGRERRR